MILTKRQKQVLSFIEESIRKNGYAPSLHEISEHFKLHSISTIHKHLVHLEDKGLLKRRWNRARAIELVVVEKKPEARAVPLQGTMAAGEPIEPVLRNERVAVPEDMIGSRDVFLLKARGRSMVDEQILDGDYVIVERRTDPRNGEVVVAVIDGERSTFKRFYKENELIRLQPANPGGKPILVPDDRVAIQGVVVGLLRKY